MGKPWVVMDSMYGIEYEFPVKFLGMQACWIIFCTQKSGKMGIPGATQGGTLLWYTWKLCQNVVLHWGRLYVKGISQGTSTSCDIPWYTLKNWVLLGKPQKSAIPWGLQQWECFAIYFLYSIHMGEYWK